ncbi:uncharacterized protein EI97DRAFT_73392 [Westerdykella ornata]|uniref:Uncharacterized protein n=1 Tax=Westerdykella ornata TaxID=318751 RepID=A0A6A6JGI1_WESOR|nr:uncharacterized protein EI97DRAFT_73392 [Westerdykella ornata]KAF2275375.1 hypothetical protein EI97DRAFT_73392 [Westerdykella ornata]
MDDKSSPSTSTIEQTLIGTWDADPSLVVTKAAWNGTALSADSWYIWDGEASFNKKTIIRLAFVSRSQQSGESKPVLGALSRTVTADYAWSEPWQDDLKELSGSLNCSQNTKLVIKVSHNGTGLGSDLKEISNSWFNLLYRPEIEGAVEAPILYLISPSGAEISSFDTSHEQYVLARTPVGHGVHRRHLLHCVCPVW